MFVKSNLLLTNCFFNLIKSIRHYTPTRACLYVPASDKKKLVKAFFVDVDCITLDCEDGVAMNKKEEARLNIKEIFDKKRPVNKRRKYDITVRVNPFSSGFLEDDLNAILNGKYLPDTILLPKVHTCEDLKTFSALLNTSMKATKPLGLTIGIESSTALINLIDICKCAKELSNTSKFFPAALLFGSDDYCVTIGARRSEQSQELIYARQKIVTVAKAFGLKAIDMVYIDYKNLDGLKAQAEEGARFGFTGKQVIHPDQIPIVHDAFVPIQEEIEWASTVLEVFKKHQSEGEGAFVYKGHMIDMPTVKQAENIMAVVNALRHN